MQNPEITTLRLHNPEHVLEKKKGTIETIKKNVDHYREIANDEAAQRAMRELVGQNLLNF